MNVLIALTVHATSMPPTSDALTKAIEPIVATMAKKYNCSMSVGLVGGPTDVSAEAAAGVKDRASGSISTPQDYYVWGSVTKLVTGTAVMRLVDQGVIKLDDAVPDHIDPFIRKMKASDPSQNFSSLADLWGPEVADVKVIDLLGMTSGVPDYDTASPSGRGHGDTFRADAYAHPNRSYSPAQLVSVPWCATGKLLFPPGRCDRLRYGNCYSSTNFVLLGLLLANHADASSWTTYDQKLALATIAHDFKSPLKFAVQGSPADFTDVHGYDVTTYNNNTGAIDITGVSGVFGGWTASDFVATAHDAATLAQELYGNFALVSKPLVAEMYARSDLTGYGLATFNLTRLTPNDVAYGHLGATYGYQSIVVYIPNLNISIAIASNIERMEQDQPQDAFCSIYNTVKAMFNGQPIPTCTFKPGYYHAGCKCV
jgi:CubicO group peptidase (beta-lactamase class C family)